jgi:hypothetical protein
LDIGTKRLDIVISRLFSKFSADDILENYLAELSNRLEIDLYDVIIITRILQYTEESTESLDRFGHQRMIARWRESEDV